MKTLLTVALCAVLVFTPNQQPVRAQTPITFVLGSLILGGIFIIYITYKTAPSGGVHKFVLQKSTDHVNWVGVVTNTLRMPLNKAMPVFEAYPVDGVSFYRVIEIPVNQQLTITPSTKEWAVAQ